jgi:hypothetical protein
MAWERHGICGLALRIRSLYQSIFPCQRHDSIKGSRGKAPLILHLEMELRSTPRLARFIPAIEPQQPWNKRLGEPQSGTETFGEASLHINGIRIPDCPAHSPTAIPPTLSRLPITVL